MCSIAMPTLLLGAGRVLHEALADLRAHLRDPRGARVESGRRGVDAEA